MEQQNGKFQGHQFEQYINGTQDRNIDNNDILTLFEDPHPNNNQFSYNQTMNYNNKDRVYHPYDSPSSTTNPMEQPFNQDTRNHQHYKMHNSGQYQTMNCEQEFNNQTNRTLTIPTSTQNLVQALPTTGQTFTQGNFIQALPTTGQAFTQAFVEITDWEKLDLPGNVAGDLVKTKNQNSVPSTDSYTLLDLSSSDKTHQQTQWQEEEPLTSKSEQEPNKEKGNLPIPIIIDNEQPFQINQEIISQIQKQVNMQKGVKQVVKIRNPDFIPTATMVKNPDLVPTTKQTKRESPNTSTSSPLRLKSEHEPEIIQHVIRGSSKPKKGRPPKPLDTSSKPDTNSSRRKRSSRNIATSKYAKLRLILEKLEDQEFTPDSPTTSQKRENRTLADFQTEVVALMKSEMSRIITRYAIHNHKSQKTQ